MNNNTAEKLAKIGLAGVCIALIAYMSYQAKLNNNLISNHMHDSTAAIRESTEVQRDLINVVGNLEKAINNFNK